MSLPFAALRALAVAALALYVLAVPAAAHHVPPPRAHVNDFAGVMSPGAVQTLETTLRAHKQATSNEIAVLTVKSLGGEGIEEFAVKAFEEWKPGQAGKDNGVLLLVAVAERKLRIEVGYGLEPLLTDGEAAAIIREKITPRFKANDYDGGVSAGVDGIIKQLTLTPSAADASPAAREATDEDGALGVLFALIFLVIIAVAIASAVQGAREARRPQPRYRAPSRTLGSDWGRSLPGPVPPSPRRSRDTDDDDDSSPWGGSSSGGLGGGSSPGGFGGFGGGRSGGGGASGGW